MYDNESILPWCMDVYVDILVYIWPMVVAYDSSKIASYSSDMFKSFYAAEVSPCIKLPSQTSLIQALRSNLP